MPFIRHSDILKTMDINNFIEKFHPPLSIDVFDLLNDKTLNTYFPNLTQLSTCEQGIVKHFEGNVAIHTKIVVESFGKLIKEEFHRPPTWIENFIVFIHDWKKPEVCSPQPNGHIKFPDHEKLAADALKIHPLILQLPEEDQSYIDFIVRYHGHTHGFFDLSEAEQNFLRASKYFPQLILFHRADRMGDIMADGRHREFLL
jgi:hypothetical protein